MLLLLCCAARLLLGLSLDDRPSNVGLKVKKVLENDYQYIIEFVESISGSISGLIRTKLKVIIIYG